MFADVVATIRQVDWMSYQISVFEMLLVVFALIKRYNLLSLLILGAVLGRGFLVVQQHTNFSGSLIDGTPFIVYSACTLIFLIYAVIKLCNSDE